MLRDRLMASLRSKERILLIHSFDILAAECRCCAGSNCLKQTRKSGNRLLRGEHNTRYVGWCEVTVALLLTLIIVFF